MSGRFAVVRWLTDRTPGVVKPVEHLKASGELVAFALLGSWAITLLFNPAVVDHNPLKDRVGYNNACVGWDTAPASYFATYVLVLAAYHGVRYSWTDSQRADVQLEAREISRRQYERTNNANAIFGAVSLALPLLSVITPDVHLWAHVSIFMGFIIARWFCMWANWQEATAVSDASWIFLYASGFTSLAFVLMAVGSFVHYDMALANGDPKPKPMVSPLFLQVFDVLWFLTLPLSSTFMPYAPLMECKLRLIEQDADEVERSRKSATQAGEFKARKVLLLVAFVFAGCFWAATDLQHRPNIQNNNEPNRWIQWSILAVLVIGSFVALVFVPSKPKRIQARRPTPNADGHQYQMRAGSEKNQCPVLNTFYNNGDILPGADGNVSQEAILQAFEGIGVEGDYIIVALRTMLAKAAAKNDGKINLFRLKELHKIDHAFSTGIRDPALNKERMDAFTQFKDPTTNRMYLTHFRDARTHFDETAFESSKGKVKDFVAGDIIAPYGTALLVEVFSSLDEKGRTFMDASDLEGLWYHGRYPANFQPHRVTFEDSLDDTFVIRPGVTIAMACLQCYCCLKSVKAKKEEEQKNLLVEKEPKQGEEGSML
jgi:hypothetical protein